MMPAPFPPGPPAAPEQDPARAEPRPVTVAEAKAMVMTWPPDVLEALFDGNWHKQAVKAELSEILARLAVGREGSASAIARAVHSELKHYAKGLWRFERHGPAPADPKRGLMHRYLVLASANIPSWHTMRKQFGAR
jgi:hypothetical protein